MTRRSRSIYVESLIRTDIEALWSATQEPSTHSRWDMRFGEIAYLPAVAGTPQQFTYATNVLGMRISGKGETLGDKDRPDGSRWSGLKFWAADPRSIISAGAGYWRYVPTHDGIRFLTRYDYRTRWGSFGRVLDRWIFRPVFGWATAWSFDRLRIWLEDGITPERSAGQYLAHMSAVAGLAGVWIYQGLVPKLICIDPEEVRIWTRIGLKSKPARHLVRVIGAAEVAAGILTVQGHRRSGLLLATAVAMPILAVGAAITDRKLMTKAFNPVSLNLSMAALAVAGFLTRSGIPSGRRPLREALDQQPGVGALP